MRHIPALMACMLCLLSACGGAGKVWRDCRGAAWGTSFSIVYNSRSMLDDSIWSIIDDVDRSLSMFNTESTVSLINAGDSVYADSLFSRVFAASSRLSALTGGCFDPTVGPAVNLWRFGFRDAGREPTDAEIDSVRPLVGIRHCRAADGRIIRKTDGTMFDFSAVAKGLGCDLIGEMFERNGCHDYMVEIGGEIAVSGKNRRGEPWHIMIDAPVPDSASVPGRGGIGVIEITGCGLATSGNYRNFRRTVGGVVWHTIDPRTCRPAVAHALSATVLAPDAMTADALATACMVMSPDSALALPTLVDGVEVMLVVPVQDTDSAVAPWRILASPGFPDIR